MSILSKLLAAPVAMAAALSACEANSPSPQTRMTGQACDLALLGAEVWTGDGFETRDVFIQDGLFLDRASARGCDETRDMAGAFLSPAFGEGHSHNIEAAWSFENLNARYLEEGVFYVLNPLNMPVPANQLRDQIARRDTVDVAFAHGAMTSYRGHPEFVYVVALSGILYGGAPREAFVGEAFHTIENLQQVEGALDILQAQGADVVKLVIANSEDFGARNAFLASDANWDSIVAASQDESLSPEERLAAAEIASTGLNPDLVPAIVERIHARGMRTVAHIDTSFDFEVAARAGVDTIVHMPGIAIGPGNPPDKGALTDSAIAAAVESGAGVVLTAGVRPEFTAEEDREALHALQRSNIRRLMEADVPVYIGTDRWQAMASYEVAYLIEIGAMTPAEAFAAWIATSQFVFPDRQIGQIAPGYEADLLVFSADPRESLEAMGMIEQAMKGGAWLERSEG